MRAVRYHPEARAEFLHEVEYYAAISTRLAELYDRAVHTAETHAATTPETWPKYKHKTRRIVDRQFKRCRGPPQTNTLCVTSNRLARCRCKLYW